VRWPVRRWQESLGWSRAELTAVITLAVFIFGVFVTGVPSLKSGAATFVIQE